MTANFLPSTAQGTISVPPSKSLTHRYLICDWLAGGSGAISGAAQGEDIQATRDCLQTLRQGGHTLDCRESGSTLRFLIPYLMLSGDTYTLTGSRRLLERPLSVYADLAAERGLTFCSSGTSVTVKGPLQPGEYIAAGNISSQFISGLLFALPLLPEASTILIRKPCESSPYIDLTRYALSLYGVRTEELTAKDPYDRILRVPGGQEYHQASPATEGDESIAAVFDAFNYLGGHVTLTGRNPDTLQGDRAARGFMDAIEAGTPDLDLAQCPDLAPVLFVLAALKHGAHFTGTEKLRYKESDRLAVMQEALSAYRPGVPMELDGHNDHRVIMAFSVLLSVTGGQLTGCEAVNKSFPGFFPALKELGIRVALTDT